MSEGAFGYQLGSRFGMTETPALFSRSLTRTAVAVTELRSTRPLHRMNTPIPREDAFLVGLQLMDFPEHQYWEDGRREASANLRVGEMLLYDLKRDPSVMLDKPFHSLHFYLPRTTLETIAQDNNARCMGDLVYRPGVPLRDMVVANLGSSLRAALERPDQASRLFVDHVTLAVAAHVAQAYGGMTAPSRAAKGRLAAWQVRKAKDIMAASLDGSVPMQDVAAACKLSASHFSRAFRRSTGLAPHQWLLHHRVEVARTMLRQSDQPLIEIALSCGFADQSHFTRVFSRIAGVSPGAWRRGA